MTRAEGIFCDPHGGIFYLIVGTFHKIGWQFSMHHSKTGKIFVAIAAWKQKHTAFTPGGGLRTAGKLFQISSPGEAYGAAQKPVK